MSIEATVQSRSPSEVVVDSVADARGVDPLELSPLFDAIDPDALDALVRSVTSSGDGTPLVTFTYHGHEVSVTTDGAVSLDDVADTR